MPELDHAACARALRRGLACTVRREQHRLTLRRRGGARGEGLRVRAVPGVAHDGLGGGTATRALEFSRSQHSADERRALLDYDWVKQDITWRAGGEIVDADGTTLRPAGSRD